jgi:phosphoglycolate phosphatase
VLNGTNRRVVVGFDLDGTLVDSVGDIADALNAALVDFGLARVDVDVVRSFVGNGARMLVQRALVHAGGDESRVGALLSTFSAHYERSMTSKTLPYPGVADALRSLKERAKIAVATNKPGRFARPLVEHMFPGLVDAVFGPDDVEGALKPDPALLTHIANALESKVVAFVGDSGVDVETARNAGVVSVGVTWGLKPGEVSGADRIAHDASELVDVLRDVLGD